MRNRSILRAIASHIGRRIENIDIWLIISNFRSNGAQMMDECNPMAYLHQPIDLIDRRNNRSDNSTALIKRFLAAADGYSAVTTGKSRCGNTGPTCVHRGPQLDFSWLSSLSSSPLSLLTILFCGEKNPSFCVVVIILQECVGPVGGIVRRVISVSGRQAVVVRHDWVLTSFCVLPSSGRRLTVFFIHFIFFRFLSLFFKNMLHKEWLEQVQPATAATLK